MNRDKEYLWHPLTQHKTAADSKTIVKTEGVYLYDDKGNKYIDGISSWYTAVYGHRNPVVVDAVKMAMDQMDQVVFTGFTHEPAMKLGEEILKIAPSSMSKIFFSDNGSTTVDIALKMSLQYWHNQGLKRTGIIAFDQAFHGDTFGAMSVSDLDVYNGPFQEHLLEVKRIEVPNDSNWNKVKEQFASYLVDAICFIYEPLVQGAAGMKIYKKDHLNELLSMAKNAGVLCVADEVMTGFGKTGTIFASDQIAEQPDIICLSKALTCGMLPMGLTLANEKIYSAFYEQELVKGFFHGHTYSANPLACAAALASITLIQSDEIKQGIQMIAQSHESFIQELQGNPKVKNLRSIGVIFAFEYNIEMERYGSKRNEIYEYFMDMGLYLRPLGNTIYLVPPYIITKDELELLYQGVRDLLSTI